MKRSRQTHLTGFSSTISNSNKRRQDDSEEKKYPNDPRFGECRRLVENLRRRDEDAEKPKVFKMNKDGSSWIIQVKGYKKTPDPASFEKSWNMHPTERKYIGVLFGKPSYENRFSQSYGVAYNYSGYKENAGTERSFEEDSVLMDLVNEINQVVDENHGPYNGCLTNWYLPEHHLAAHADDEKQLKPDSPIFSLSWGGPRRFIVKPKKGQEKFSKTIEIFIEDGDLIIMGGLLQQTHTHEVPRWRKTKDPTTRRRINWTVRAFIS